MTRAVVIIACAFAMCACGESEQQAESQSSVSTDTVTGELVDAGDEAFVKQVIPLIWGRRPHSIEEVRLLVQVAEQLGREGLVRSMARSIEFVDWWEIWIRDSLSISRIGYYSNAGCYGRVLQPEPLPNLAEHIRDNSHHKKFAGKWTMRDLIRSTLVLDDLSPVWTTNLVADLSKALDDQNFLAAFGQRRNRTQKFLRTYLNRRMNCLGCHNSEWSITGNSDPALDRTWEIPGHFEKALFGQSNGRDHVDLTPFFRRRGLIAGYYYTKEALLDDLCPMGMCAYGDTLTEEDKKDLFYPWGWDEACGEYFPPEKVRDDDAEDVSGFFVEPHGKNASAWDLNEMLRNGFSSLRDGLVVADDLSVAPEMAFAWLVSMNIADRVWEAAFGSRLTIVNYFPRNQSQRDILSELTHRFVSSGYSLVELLVAVTTHEYFNVALPGDGGTATPFEPVFNPFVDDSIPVSAQRNHLGHVVHRAPARVMLRSAYRAMGWPETAEFLIYFMAPDTRLQRNIGVFHKAADPGFGGVSFQSALAWEATVGICDNKVNSSQCSLQPILDLPEGQISGNTICEICGNRDYVCDWDHRCCDVDWDTVCALDCGEAEKIFIDSFPKPQVFEGADFIQALTLEAEAQGATVGDAVKTLKDRLLTEPRLVAGAEQAQLEALLGTTLDSRVTDIAETEAGLRRVCGAFLASPEFILVGAPPSDVLSGEQKAEPLSVQLPEHKAGALCNGLVAAMFGNTDASCQDGVITIQKQKTQ